MFGVIPPETFRSVLVVDDHLIDTTISLVIGMTTTTTAMILPEHRREEPGKILGPIHVLFLV